MAVINGTSGNDFKRGTTGVDTIDGGAGSDELYGLAGNDSLVGGTGNDTVDGGVGNDTISAGGDDDRLIGGRGNDSMDGGAGTDTAQYTTTSLTTDMITGGASYWSVATGGLEGSDRLVGAETLLDQDGNRFLLVGNGGFATIQAAVDAAADGDTILIGRGTFAGNVSVGSKALSFVGESAAYTIITGEIDITGTVTGDTVFKDLTINASGHQYGVKFNALAGSYDYTDEADVTTTVLSTLTLNGVSISGAAENGLLYVRPANSSEPATTTDLLGAISILNSSFADNGTGTGSAGRGHVNLFGFNGDLTVTDNSFSVSTGLTARKGFAWTGAPRTGTLSDAGDVTFTGNDFTGSYSTDAIAVYYHAGFSSFDASGNTAAVSALFGVLNFDTLGGSVDLSTFFDSATNSSGGVIGVLQGTSAAQSLVGTQFNDVFAGNGGSDSLDGGAGDDLFAVVAGAAPGSITGGDGTDVVTVDGTGSVALSGSAETIDLTGFAKTNTLALNVDASEMTGVTSIVGNSAANAITGGSGAQAISGAAGNDSLVGGGGDDSLDGGTGVDVATFSASDLTAGQITSSGGAWTVASSDEGSDTVVNVEMVQDSAGQHFLLVGNGGYATIQAAINAASAGDTIEVAAGTYAEALTINKAVTIYGPNGAIDGAGTRGGEAIITGLSVVTATTGNVVITGLTFNYTGATNSLSGNGGGMLQVTGTADVEISNNRFTTDNPQGGGSGGRAIMLPTNATGDIIIDGNFFGGPATSGFSGANWQRGVWSDGASSSLTITDNTFTYVRTALNLDSYDNATSDVSGNVINNSGTGVAVGFNGDTTTTNIDGNTFNNVDTEFNLRNFTAGITFTVDENAADTAAGTIDGLGVVQVLGGSGADSITGAGNADLLVGNAAADTLDGQGGNDLLSGGAGNDLLKGGAGDDTAVFSGTTAQTTLIGNFGGSVSAIGVDGTDLLQDMESASFSDGTVALPGAAHQVTVALTTDTGSSGIDNLTYDAHLSGVGRALTTVVLTGDVNDTVTSDASGNWSYNATGLADGVYTVTVTQTDAVGDESSADITYTLDTHENAPNNLNLIDADDTGANNNDNITRETTPTFTGTAGVGTVVELFLGGAATGFTTVTDADGNWSITYTTALEPAPEGEFYIFSAKATDAAGNTSILADTLPILVDTFEAVPTGLALAEESDSSRDVGGPFIDDITNVTTPFITGTAGKGDLVKLYEGETLLGEGYADADTGAFSIQIEDALSAGSHNITATATDAAGNTSDISTDVAEFLVDVAEAAPSTPELASDASGRSDTDTVTNADALTFAGTGDTAGDLISILAENVEGDRVVIGTGLAGDGAKAYSIATDISGLADGTYTIYGVAEDKAGNVSDASGSMTITVDRHEAAPDAPVLDAGSDTGAADGSLTSVTTPTINGSGASPFAYIQMFVDGDLDAGAINATADEFGNFYVTADADGNFSITVSAALTGGPHELQVRATDVAGNTSSLSAVLSLEIDTGEVAPGGLDLLAADDSGDSHTDNLTNDNTPTISGLGKVGDVVHLYDTNGTTLLGEATVTGDGDWSIVSSELGDGEHSLTATQTDAANNTSAASTALVVTIDTQEAAPTGLDLAEDSDTGSSQTDDITLDSTPTITGSGIAGDVVTLYDGLTVLGTDTVAGDGSWSIEAAELDDGTHSLVAIQRDAADNTSDASDAITITIDTQAPTPFAPELTTATDNGLSNSDGRISSTTATLTVVGAVHSVVTIYQDGTLLGTATEGPDGVYTYDVTGLADDANGTDYAFTAKETDLAGNTTELEGESLIITVDQVDPDAPTSHVLTLTSVTGDSFTISGTAEADAYIDGTGFSTTAGGGGTWSANGTAATGFNTLAASATDVAGNTGDSADFFTLIVGATGATVVGSTASDAITGGNGDDSIDGNGDEDSLAGGDGNDTIATDGGDEIDGGAGTDLVISSVDFNLSTAASNVEDLTLTGTATSGTGTSGSNVITGNDNGNTLDGMAGDVDTLVGGAGDDTYYVHSTGDVVTEATAGSTDAVISSASYTLSANLESLTLTTAGTSGTGNTEDNTITGTDGGNTLDGGEGEDTLVGGTGADIFRVDNAGDSVTGNGGADAVFASVSYSLAGADINHLGLTGDGNIDGTGNGADNTITGNGGDNIIDGGAGADSMVGGAGNDTYYVDDALDAVVEDAEAGADSVFTSVASYTLGTGLENLTLSFTGDGLTTFGAAGTGNSGSNVITGGTGNDTLTGGGASTLDGGDTLNGGDGDDTLVVSGIAARHEFIGGAGNDVVNFTALSANLLVNLNLTTAQNTGAGSDIFSGIENITTGAGTDSIIGTSAAERIAVGDGNDTVEGGGGGDTILGGAGSDWVSYANATTAVFINLDDNSQNDGAAAGDVFYGVNGTIVGGVQMENVIGTNFSDEITGRNNGSILMGLDGDDMLQGLEGNDTLIGGAGTDSLLGGGGTDLASYASSTTGLLINIADTSLSTGDAQDDFYNFIDQYLGSLNNDTMVGDATADNLQGNDGADSLSGENGNDTLLGGNGNDTMEGGLGNDSMDGGAGIDTVSYANATGAITLNLNSAASQDTTNAGSDRLANIENVVGSTFGDNLVGSTANNMIDGGNGNDVINGGAGNDVLLGGAGTDNLNGSTGSDTLTGGAGKDTLTGGTTAGTNDTFVWTALSDSGNTVALGDRVTDFQVGIDFFDFSAIDADSGTAGVQHFSFTGYYTTGNFTAAGQVRAKVNGSVTELHFNTDSTLTNDEMVITLTGAITTLTAADFIFS